MFSQLKKAAALAIFVAAAASVIAVTASGSPAVGGTLKQGMPAPEFSGIDKWLNSDPLTMQQLRGKVVLVDFWTYTCINCINTLPYVKSWDQKYRDKGLAVIGVHTPEYPFERSTDNVKTAIKRFDLRFPVAQDNRYATWNAYDNQYWPAFYLIDKKGKIVYTHFGEGQYAETEAKIQALLAQPD
ncbi:MAG TPA: thioredoxin family protein [Herbaspirillum sp.]|jgi:thiol-disulfide isomerase/thioredoxin